MSASPSAGSYPGNPSLPVEVREKILATFRHALNLFSAGNFSDCLIGCAFILKMDQRFTPAQRLREKVRNRNSDVDISDLMAFANPPAPPGPTVAPAPAPEPAPEPRVERPDPRRLLAEAEKKCEARDFEGAIAVATQVLALDPGNKDALAMMERAAGKKAMQPLVESSRAHAEQALAEGRFPDAYAWRSKGVPVYGIYPYPISAQDLERMHGNDERVPIASLESGLKMITNTLLEVAAK